MISRDVPGLLTRSACAPTESEQVLIVISAYFKKLFFFFCLVIYTEEINLQNIAAKKQ